MEPRHERITPPRDRLEGGFETTSGLHDLRPAELMEAAGSLAPPCGSDGRDALEGALAGEEVTAGLLRPDHTDRPPM